MPKIAIEKNFAKNYVCLHSKSEWICQFVGCDGNTIDLRGLFKGRFRLAFEQLCQEINNWESPCSWPSPCSHWFWI